MVRLILWILNGLEKLILGLLIWQRNKDYRKQSADAVRFKLGSTSDFVAASPRDCEEKEAEDCPERRDTETRSNSQYPLGLDTVSKTQQEMYQPPRSSRRETKYSMRVARGKTRARSEHDVPCPSGSTCTFQAELWPLGTLAPDDL